MWELLWVHVWKADFWNVLRIHNDFLTTCSPAEGKVRSIGGTCSRWRMRESWVITFAAVSMVRSVWQISELFSMKLLHVVKQKFDTGPPDLDKFVQTWQKEQNMASLQKPSFSRKKNYLFFPRASERRVLLIVGVCQAFSHFHIFTSSHNIFKSSHLLILTSSHLHILPSSHLFIFKSAHLNIFSSSHLLIFTSSHVHTFTSSHPQSSSRLLIPASSHLHILTSSHLLIFTSAHLLIFASSHLHIFTSHHLHIFTFSLALLLSCSLALLLSCPLAFSFFLFLS